MSTVVLDTNVVSYLMRGHSLSESYRPYLEGRTLAISFMTVGELYEGAYRRGWGVGKLTKLKETTRSYVVIPFSFELCREWGAIRYERRQQPIAVDDAWIAATARSHGCPLVTHNPNDFRGIDGALCTHRIRPFERKGSAPMIPQWPAVDLRDRQGVRAVPPARGSAW